MRRTLAVLAASAVCFLVASGPATAQEASVDALVFVVRDVTFPELVRDPPLSGAVDVGGIAMLRGPDPTTEALEALDEAGIPVIDAGRGAAGLASIAAQVEGREDEILVVVVALRPATGAGSEGPDAVLVARGEGGALVKEHFDVTPPTLSSDSTKRSGIVTPDDLVATIGRATGTPVEGDDVGMIVRRDPAPPPIGLYLKYLQYRELTVPIQAGVEAVELALGIGLVVVLWQRRRVPRWLLTVCLAAVLGLPMLFLALLLVGHLPSLTYATVVPVITGAYVVAGAIMVRVAGRLGIGPALAIVGGIGLGGLVVESLLRWTAAFAPMLGGSHLDGMRFYGMPNVELGIALGGGVLVAAQLRSTWAGVWLLAAASLWAGLPWFGADIGGAVTLGAAAALWWGIRELRRPGIVVLATAGASVAAAGVTVATNRYLTDSPTHIGRATEGASVGDLADRIVDRLGIGLRQLADQPAAALPVVGLATALLAMWRPPASLGEAFAEHPWARDASLTILLGSVVAYLSNDTGATALGLGFGMAMVTIFAVSLATARGRMEP